MTGQCFQETEHAQKPGKTMAGHNLTIVYCVCVCRQRGGIAEEQAERQRWIDREQHRIMESVNGKVYLVFVVVGNIEICMYYRYNNKPDNSTNIQEYNSPPAYKSVM